MVKESWTEQNYGRLKTLEAENTVRAQLTFQGKSKSLPNSANYWRPKSLGCGYTVWAHFTFQGKSKSLAKLSELQEAEESWMRKILSERCLIMKNSVENSIFFLRGRNALLGNWRANVFEYILYGKSMWRSTPSELRIFFWELGTPISEIKQNSVRFTLRRNEERMFSYIYCCSNENWLFRCLFITWLDI